MKIAIIGTGNVGGSLATQWSRAGHHIHLGVRDIENFKGKELLRNNRTSVHSIKEAVELSEAILVATPPQISQSLLLDFGDTTGKVILDATNSIRSKPQNHPTAYHVFEDLTKAEVVKCFNSTGFENIKNPNYGSISLDMFMAGESGKAKEIATLLSQDAGFENCYDFGGGDRVELLEKFALSWINLAIFQRNGRDMGFKVVFR